ncbi:MAG: succinate dehydrogenase/fumarate reductase iron-sulfur subunit [Acidobacteria bacterium]|nr:succinate dehydrogenase/fumarate reductase iron-sulfur subunit [Acidobacteriota bacterium]
MTRHVILRVKRANVASTQRDFDVPVPTVAGRVLDLLLYAREYLDPTLEFRYACRVGMCGSCAVTINGREALACESSVAELPAGAVLEVAPLAGLPVRRDLVVDLDPFLATFIHAEAGLKPRQPRLREVPVIPPGGAERALIERHNGCVTCGACTAATSRLLGAAGTLGPAALNRVLMLALDERDAKGHERLARVAGDAALAGHDTLGPIDELCPVGIPLSAGLRELRTRL